MEPIAAFNPSGLDLEAEFPHPIDTTANWTEYYYFFAYDAERGTGVSIHVGREPFDTSIWRAAVSVYLPGGEQLLAGRYFGRDGHARGPGAGPLRITCLQPGQLFAIEFDGVIPRVRRADLATGTPPDAPAEPLRLALTFAACAPLEGTSPEMLKEQSWASGHWDQICRIEGDMTIGGERQPFAGVGVRDHSVGVRDYAPVTGNFWFNGIFPDGSAISAQYTKVGEAVIRHAHVWNPKTGENLKYELTECPSVGEDANGTVPADPMDDPATRKMRLLLTRGDEQHVIEGEIVHAAITSFLSPSDELIGTARDRGDDLQACECPIRAIWNGQVGYGVRERIIRISTLR